MIQLKKTKKEKTMIQLNDNINFLSTEISRHRRNLSSHSPHTFSEIYMKSNCHAPHSGMHKEIFTLLLQMTEQRKGRLAVAAPRGHAKSTIVSLVYVLWCVLYLKERLILIASNTQEQAITLLKDIKHQLKNNPLIISDFPEICSGKKPKPWRNNRIQLPNGAMICVYGVSQSPRGIKNDKDRPGLIIADDLENEEQAESEEQRDKLRSWFRGTLLNTGHPDTNVVVVGTILHQGSLLANLVDPNRNSGWMGKKYKAVKKFSDNPQLWEQWSSIFCHREEHEGSTGPEAAKLYFEANLKEMLKSTEVLWPEWESYYQLMVIRESEGHRSFQSEKQNEPIDPQQCIFKEEDFIFWDDDYRDVQHLIQSLNGKGRFCGACDPSLGKSTRGDYTAIVILLRDDNMDINYVIAADLLHCSPSQTIDRITEYAGMYKFKKFAIEINNFQELMAEKLDKRIIAYGRRLPIHEITSRSNKQSRIAGLEPYIKQGNIRFCRKHRKLLDQLTQFPLAKNDDGPDALEMAMQAAKKKEVLWSISEF
jgi:predicted phage terminase large subunit-like protein